MKAKPVESRGGDQIGGIWRLFHSPFLKPVDCSSVICSHARMEILGAVVDDLPFPLNLLRPGLPLYLTLGAVVLIGGFFLFFFVTCMYERQRLSGDVEPAAEPFPYAPIPYWKATRGDALKFGLQHGGDFATRKDTSVVKGLMSLFITQDRLVIAAIVSGSIAAAKTKKTILRSRLATGRVIESSDEGGTEDLSGVIERAILVNAGIVELMAFHIQRIKATGAAALPFKTESLLHEYEKMDLARGERLVLLGLARWADWQQTSIRMTFRGAIGMVRKLVQQTGKVSGQQQRTHIRRAGSRPGD